jgi:hypothetical protein
MDRGLLLSAATLSASLGFGACTGTIGDGSGLAGGTSDRPPTPSDEGPTVRAAPAGLRLLTSGQYTRTIEALLGERATFEAETRAIAAARGGLSARSVEELEAAGRAAAAKVFADPARRNALVGCTPSLAAGDDCTRTFLARFGRRAFRRPLEDGEATRYATLARDAGSALGDPWRGVEIAVATFLQSPAFVHRVDLGVRDGALVRYTPYEIASRLAFFLWDQGPDDPLLDAAARGDLANKEGIAKTAAAMLEDPRARVGVRRLFTDWLDLDGLGALTKDTTLFPKATATLGPAMREEIERVAEGFVFEGIDLRRLYDGRRTFVDAELAALYGLDTRPKTFSPVELPADGGRAGVLGFGGILALHAKPNKTFPTGRGKFVRESLLCQTVPPPPPDVNTNLPPPAPGEKRTMREILARHRADPTCAGCHALLDPIGLALESFDAIGAFRTDDDGLPIDPSCDLDGRTFADAKALGRLLADDPRTMRCAVRQLFRIAVGHLEEPGEEPALAAIDTAFAADGHRVRRAVLEIVTSDLFLTASPSAEASDTASPSAEASDTASPSAEASDTASAETSE